MTYKEAYNKIIDAYFKDEIKPMRSKFCFCGNLCDKDPKWNYGLYDSLFGYSYGDFRKMEMALFDGMEKIHTDGPEIEIEDPLFEEALFVGMCAALDVLKQIHIERGENVDDVPAFTKRNLLTDVV